MTTLIKENLINHRALVTRFNNNTKFYNVRVLEINTGYYGKNNYDIKNDIKNFDLISDYFFVEDSFGYIYMVPLVFDETNNIGLVQDKDNYEYFEKKYNDLKYFIS